MIRNQGIITLQIFPCHIRSVYDSDPRPVYLMALDDWIREDGISTGGKGFYTRAQTIVEKVLKHTAKIMKKQPQAINSLFL